MTFDFVGRSRVLSSRSRSMRNEEEKLDAIANGLSKLSYWLVIITCFGFLALFFLVLFGEFIGFVHKDQDIVEWCEEYHPNWSYEQCESMVGR